MVLDFISVRASFRRSGRKNVIIKYLTLPVFNIPPTCDPDTLRVVPEKKRKKKINRGKGGENDLDSTYILITQYT